MRCQHQQVYKVPLARSNILSKITSNSKSQKGNFENSSRCFSSFDAIMQDVGFKGIFVDIHYEVWQAARCRGLCSRSFSVSSRFGNLHVSNQSLASIDPVKAYYCTGHELSQLYFFGRLRHYNENMGCRKLEWVRRPKVEMNKTFFVSNHISIGIFSPCFQVGGDTKVILNRISTPPFYRFTLHIKLEPLYRTQTSVWLEPRGSGG